MRPNCFARKSLPATAPSLESRSTLRAGQYGLWDQACRDREPTRLIRSEEHTSELQSLMRISYAVFCLKKKKYNRIVLQQRYVDNALYAKHHTPNIDTCSHRIHPIYIRKITATIPSTLST